MLFRNNFYVCGELHFALETMPSDAFRRRGALYRTRAENEEVARDSETKMAL